MKTEMILSTSIHDRVIAILSEHDDPYREANLSRSGVLTRCELKDSELDIELTFTYPLAGMTRSLVKQLKPKLEEIKDVNEAFIRVRHEIPVSPAREGTESIPGVRQVICVASGKGGGASPPPPSILRWPYKQRVRVLVIGCGYLWTLPSADVGCSGPTS